DDDGYDDLAVGAPGKFGNQGRVFLYRGSATRLVAVRALTQAGLGNDEPGDRFGYALVPRWSGSRWQLVVGAPNEKIGASTAVSGYAFLFDGNSDPNTLLTPLLGFSQNGVPNEQNENGDRFGSSLAGGYIDTDNAEDIVVGAPGEDSSTGAAYVYLSS